MLKAKKKQPPIVADIFSDKALRELLISSDHLQKFWAAVVQTTKGQRGDLTISKRYQQDMNRVAEFINAVVMNKGVFKVALLLLNLEDRVQ